MHHLCYVYVIVYAKVYRYVPALGDFRKYPYPTTSDTAYKSVPFGVWCSICKQETGVCFSHATKLWKNGFHYTKWHILNWIKFPELHAKRAVTYFWVLRSVELELLGIRLQPLVWLTIGLNIIWLHTQRLQDWTLSKRNKEDDTWSSW